MIHVLQPQATFPRSASSRDARSHATSRAAAHVSIAHLHFAHPSEPALFIDLSAVFRHPSLVSLAIMVAVKPPS